MYTGLQWPDLSMRVRRIVWIQEAFRLTRPKYKPGKHVTRQSTRPYRAPFIRIVCINGRRKTHSRLCSCANLAQFSQNKGNVLHILVYIYIVLSVVTFLSERDISVMQIHETYKIRQMFESFKNTHRPTCPTNFRISWTSLCCSSSLFTWRYFVTTLNEITT